MAFWTDWLQPIDHQVVAPVYIIAQSAEASWLELDSDGTWIPSEPIGVGAWADTGVFSSFNGYSGNLDLDHMGFFHIPYSGLYPALDFYTLYDADVLSPSWETNWINSGLLRVKYRGGIQPTTDYTAYSASSIARTNPWIPYYQTATITDPFTSFVSIYPPDKFSYLDWEWETTLVGDGARPYSEWTSPEPYWPSSTPVSGGWTITPYPWGVHPGEPYEPADHSSPLYAALSGVMGALDSDVVAIRSWDYTGTKGDRSYRHKEGEYRPITAGTTYVEPLKIPHQRAYPHFPTAAEAERYCILNGRMFSVYPDNIVDGASTSNQMLLINIYCDVTMRPSRVRIKLDKPGISPLRMTQRDDGLGRKPTPRLNKIITKNNSTSLQSAPTPRVGPHYNVWW